MKLEVLPAIAPSILSADFARLGQEVRAVDAAGAQFIHVDVMDGQFVPNLTMGPDIVAAIRRTTRLPLDVHLMIETPDRLIPDFIKAGADIVTVHVEACTHLHRTLQSIREAGIKAGVALNPATPLVFLEPILEELDLILIMTVNPGFGGQKPILSAIRKLNQARALIDGAGLDSPPLLEVDGGVKVENVLDYAVADVLVSGSGVFLWPEKKEGRVKAGLSEETLSASYSNAIRGLREKLEGARGEGSVLC